MQRPINRRKIFVKNYRDFPLLTQNRVVGVWSSRIFLPTFRTSFDRSLAEMLERDVQVSIKADMALAPSSPEF